MKTKLFKRLSMLLFGGVMVLSAALGISNNKETKTVYAENSTYTMTIDSSASGNNNVHYTSTSTKSINYNDVEWSIAVTGTSSITSNKTYCQIGSKGSPASKVELSTNAFAGMTILSASLDGYCMSNTGPSLTIVAGDTEMLKDEPLVKTNSTNYPSTTNNVLLGDEDSITFTITSSASAAIVISKITVQYSDSDSPTATYDVSYDANGSNSGSAPTDSNEYSAENNSVTVLGNTGNLEKTGYTFGGWNTKADGTGTNYQANDTFTISSNTKLYANWIADICEISFDANDATSGLCPSNINANYDSKIQLPDNSGSLEKTGYTFGGWNTKADGSGTKCAVGDSYTVKGNVIFYAIWNEVIPGVNYKLVTDASKISVNDSIIIVQAGNGNLEALSTEQKSNNRGIIEVTESNGIISVNNDAVQIITLVKGSVDNTYAFYTGEGYLYAAGANNNNHLKTQNFVDGNSSFEITINNGVATIKSKGSATRNWLRYNSNSSCFSCYSSGQNDVSIYKKEVADIALSESENIVIGSSKTITIEAPGDVIWSIDSGNEFISLSNQSNTGVNVTGIAIGTAVIKATCGELSATCTINVTEIPDYTGSYTITSNTTKYLNSLTESDIGNYLNNFDIFTPKKVADVRLGSGSDIARTCIAIPGTNDAGETGEFSFDCPNGYIASKVIVDCFKDQYKDTTLSINNSYWENFSYNENSSMKYVALCYSKNVDISAISRLWIKSITVTLIKEESNSIVDTFFSQILDLTAADCAALDVKNDTWTILQTGFGNIEENYFEAAYEIIDSAEFVEANARYDYIVAKYGYNNFLEHNVTTFKQANTRPFEIPGTEDSNLLLIIIALSSTLTLSVVLLYRKKKHTN